MVTLYTVFAIGGAALLLGQFVLSMAGFDGVGDDLGDVSGDVDLPDEYTETQSASTQFFNILSFRSAVAAIACFGLAGRLGVAGGLSPFASFAFALLVAVVAMVTVAWATRFLYGLRSAGNVRIQNCLGAIGTVYLTVPGHRRGSGKVTVSVQERTMEYLAVTNDDAIPTGARVKVVGIRDPGTLEVEPT